MFREEVHKALKFYKENHKKEKEEEEVREMTKEEFSESIKPLKDYLAKKKTTECTPTVGTINIDRNIKWDQSTNTWKELDKEITYSDEQKKQDDIHDAILLSRTPYPNSNSIVESSWSGVAGELIYPNDKVTYNEEGKIVRINLEGLPDDEYKEKERK